MESDRENIKLFIINNKYVSLSSQFPFLRMYFFQIISYNSEVKLHTKWFDEKHCDIYRRKNFSHLDQSIFISV